MNEQLKTGIALIASFFLTFAGASQMLTSQLEDMAVWVAWIFIITGVIGIIANGLKWKKINRSPGTSSPKRNHK
ncbi:hypothetical protein [Halobacillus kuroshimensis]|uniref:hypothetical protein n=1 Tax=Halobacillus kuroshimensis TaxID=302481 RepID=UPI0004840D41|nr:hypothetical protein [Halobacillus kuroshimensis]